MIPETLPPAPINPDEMLGSVETTERLGQMVTPFGILEGMLTKLPDMPDLAEQESQVDGIKMATKGSVYPTVTAKNDRCGDRED
jgi:hypothetical protein